MRALAERANALIKHFKTLKHVTLDLRAITATALVILTPPQRPRVRKPQRSNLAFSSPSLNEAGISDLLPFTNSQTDAKYLLYATRNTELSRG